jgi:hypothetical protein
MSKTVIALGFIVIAAMSALPAAAQESNRESGPYSLALVAGVSQFDLSGTGTAPIIGGRVAAALKSWLAIEGALGTLRPDESSRSIRYFIPEAQLQFQIPTRVRPYLGFGGGYFMGSGLPKRGTASLSGGLIVPVRDKYDARGELRVRGIGSSFGGATAEWTIGIGYRVP